MSARASRRPDGSRRRDPLRFHRAHFAKGAFGEGVVPRIAE
jgi:hypothetical protein